jgi:hypothetical protein
MGQLAADAGEVYACVEIAKYHEHTGRDYTEALHWTQTAIAILDSQELLIYQHSNWITELEWRQSRLMRKIGGSQP